MSSAMPATDPTVDVLIIGAGMAGLCAAMDLQRAGRRVLLLDKGRGVGGRLASRRVGAATFDHGAQFITARDPCFAAAMQQWQETGVVAEWCRGFAELADGHPRWRGHPAMTSLPRHLAQGLAVRLGQPVVAVRRSRSQWVAETTAGELVQAGAVVLTPPVPQSLALLERGAVPLAPALRAHLAGIDYERCLAVLAVLDGPSRLPEPGALVPATGPIAWVADNHRKGVSAEPAVTLHATPDFSREYWDRDRGESGHILLQAAADWLSAGIKTFQVHGWRFSKPLRVEPERCLRLNDSPPLILAGDAFAGPRVEGAALSGWAAANAILQPRP
jgi:renalase